MMAQNVCVEMCAFQFLINEDKKEGKKLYFLTE